MAVVNDKIDGVAHLKSDEALELRAVKNTALMEQIFNFCYALKKERLSLEHPDWDQAKLHLETMALIERAASR